MWPDFTQEEKREFVSLLIARIEVRSSEGKSDGRKNARVVELKVKLHLPELLGGGQDGESAAGRLVGKRPSFTLEAKVRLAAASLTLASSVKEGRLPTRRPAALSPS